ncbi:hypothetical protein HY250_03240 [Candidatus Azambacteria bacterium]|nr:hypothetical protein [Candidatus Azambacteria bacterium]
MKYLAGIFMGAFLLVATLWFADVSPTVVWAKDTAATGQAFLPEVVPEVLAAMPATFKDDNVMQLTATAAIGAGGSRGQPCWAVSTIDNFVLRNNYLYLTGTGLANLPGHPLRL